MSRCSVECAQSTRPRSKILTLTGEDAMLLQDTYDGRCGREPPCRKKKRGRYKEVKAELAKLFCSFQNNIKETNDFCTSSDATRRTGGFA